MKAVVCRQLGSFENLQYGDFPEPDLGPGEIRIAIRATTLGFHDMLLVQGRYQHGPQVPFVQGRIPLVADQR